MTNTEQHCANKRQNAWLGILIGVMSGFALLLGLYTAFTR